MNLEQWRKKQAAGQVVTLPSGLDVTIRMYGLVDLVLDGKLPADLEPVVDSMMKQGLQPDVAALPQINRVMNLLLADALLGPEGLAVEELPASDRQWLFRHIATAASAEQAAGVGAASGGEGVRAAAK